jgi:hypothetical protein
VSSVPRLSRRVRSVLVAVDARCELQLVDWPRAWPSSRRPCRPSSVPPGRPWTCRSGRGEWYDIRDSFADSFDMRFLRRTLTRVRRIYLRIATNARFKKFSYCTYAGMGNTKEISLNLYSHHDFKNIFKMFHIIEYKIGKAKKLRFRFRWK